MTNEGRIPMLAPTRRVDDHGSLPPTDDSKSSYSRTKVSLACLACKQKRVRCSGKAPCDKCLRSSTNCVFDESQDRRKGIKRKFQELEQTKQLLEDLIGTLRGKNEEQREGLLEVIRNDGGVKDIMEFMEHRAIRPKHTRYEEDDVMEAQSRSTSISDKPSESSRRMPQLHELCEPPFRVPAKPWVTIVDDDDFVSRLVSVFLTWINPTYFMVEPELFLRDMRAGKTSSKYCSSFLVNAICAIACAHCDLPGTEDIPGDPRSRGSRFIKELDRLWEKEESKATLTNVQSLYVWTVAECMVGRDQVGWSLLSRMNQFFRELGFHRTDFARRRELEQEDHEYSSAMNLVAWGTYSCNCVFSIIMLKPNALSPPAVPRPYSGAELAKTQTWWPFPRLQQEKQLPMNRICDAICDLSLISGDVQDFLFVNGAYLSQDDFWSVFLSLVKRLWSWKKSPYEGLVQEHGYTSVLVDIYSWYTMNFVTLCEYPHRLTAMNAEYSQLSRSYSIMAMHDMVLPMKEFRRSFTFDIIPPYTLAACAMGAGVLLYDIKAPETEEAILTFLNSLLVGGRRALLFAGLVRVLLSSVVRMKITLPASINELLQNFEKGSWEDNYAKRIQSSFPSYADTMYPESTDTYRLSEMLEQMEGLNLEGSSSSQREGSVQASPSVSAPSI